MLQCLAYFALFLVVANTIRSLQQIKTVYGVIVGVATTMAIVGMVQHFTGTSAIYGIRETGYAQFFGPYINRNHIATYLGAAIIVALGLFLAQPRPRHRQVKSAWRRIVGWLNDQITQHRIVLLYALVVMFGALCLSLSRGGLLSFVVGLICLGVWLANRWSWPRLIVCGVAVVAVMAAGIAWIDLTPLIERFEALTDEKQIFTWGIRLPIYKATWELSKDFWPFGIGFDAFSAVLPHYQPAEAHSRYFHFLRAHNDFLQLLAEMGVLGVAIVAVGIWRFGLDIIRHWQTRRDPFISVMVPAGCVAVCVMTVHSAVDFPLRIPANAILVTVLLALTYSCVHLPRHGASVTAVVSRHGFRHPLYGAMCRMGAAIAAIILMMGSVEAVRLARSDLLYPQQTVLQKSHWVHHLEPEMAQQRLQAALHWTPDNPKYWRALGNIEQHQAQHHLPGEGDEAVPHEVWGKLRQAAHHYENALQWYPTEPHTHIAWLQVQQQLETLQAGSSALPASFEQRLALYRHIASMAPVNPHIQYGLGRLVLADQIEQIRQSGELVQVARSYESAPYFQAALSFDPTYGERVLNACRQYRSASTVLSCLTASIPNDWQGHLIAAKLLDHVVWAQARFHFLAAHSLAPSEPHPVHLYAQALQRHGEWAAAVEMWETLRRLKPADTVAYHGLADAYRELGDEEGLLQAHRQLVILNPKHVGYRRQLGTLYQKRGMLAQAATNWRQFTEIHPSDITGYIELAKVYDAGQAYDEALAIMLKVRGIASDHAGYQRLLAHLYEQTGQSDKALRTWERLVALEPSNPVVLYQMAEHLRQSGEPLLALGYYRRAIELKPNHAEFNQTLREVQQQLRLSSGQ